ncbi:OmpA family protein [Pseudoduganella sp.]|uniref:OmpA family protein n=1 Tax=Pseudoduganella sp. TaxID=1880898 RepID=UPI0035AEA13D
MKKAIVAVVGATMLTSCATDPRTGQPSFKETFASDDPCSNNSRNIGIAVGAIAGAIIGNQVKHSDKGRILGALVGAAAGGLIGHDMDRRRCELARVAKQYELDMTVANVSADGTVQAASDPAQASSSKDAGVGMVVEVRDKQGEGAQFDSNSDQLTPRAQSYFTAIAQSYSARTMASHIQDPAERQKYIAQIASRKILLIGHTDDTGSSRLNADLSERRAKAVTEFMEKQGIPRDVLFYQGAGESYPIADNASEEGRARNRRVEIVEVADAGTFERFLAARKPRYAFYRTQEAAARPADPAAQQKPAAPAAPAAPARLAKEKAAPARAAEARVAEAKAPAAKAGARVAAATPAAPALPAAPAATRARSSGPALDFGGMPLAKSSAIASIGQLESNKSYFSLISSAHASEMADLADCTRDRPRVAHGVKSLASGKTYRTSEFLPGLYGKTWTDQVNAHQIVLNKVSVLAGDGSLANLPEFKVYANYNPARNSNPVPDVSLSPEVNTYLGERGLLYRVFLDGRAGLSCVDIVFHSEGGPAAKAGRIVYERGAVQYAADFKPKIYQK